MAILVDKNSRVIVQGITGTAGRFHTERMLKYGTKIVAGTSPGKGGQKVFDLPVYDSVQECVENEKADTSVIFLPAKFVMEAA
ncbi:MAG: succinate--CoA ligase subunit alpha, partial [Candidatus Zixiibacteriota bacterium]